jgi:hypothetical protein
MTLTILHNEIFKSAAPLPRNEFNRWIINFVSHPSRHPKDHQRLQKNIKKVIKEWINTSTTKKD